MNSTDKIFYTIGMVLMGAFAVLCVLINTNLFVPTDIDAPCTFRQLTGFLCPGCNGTHAVCALAKGNFVESLRLHPFVPFTLFTFCAYVLWNSFCLISNKSNTKIPFWHFHIAFVYIALLFLFVPWIFRNIQILTY